LVRKLLTYRRPGSVAQVQQAHVHQVAAAEALAVAQAEIGRQGLDQRCAVFGPYPSGLLELHDVAAHLPVGLDQLSVDGLHRLHPAAGAGVGDLLQ